MPKAGQLTLRAAVDGDYYLRPPHWAPRQQVRAFLGTHAVAHPEWSGAYVRFHAHPGDELTITYPLVRFEQQVKGLWKSCAPKLTVTYAWLGNMVTHAAPAGGRTPLFTGAPRVLPTTQPGAN